MFAYDQQIPVYYWLVGLYKEDCYGVFVGVGVGVID